MCVLLLADVLSFLVFLRTARVPILYNVFSVFCFLCVRHLQAGVCTSQPPRGGLAPGWLGRVKAPPPRRIIEGL